MNTDRRKFLGALTTGTSLGAVALMASLWRRNQALRALSWFGSGGEAPTRMTPEQVTVRFPQKADLIMLTDRPPQLETPLHYFRQDFTPNEAFFVRWHEAGIPTTVDLQTFRLSIAGHVNTPLSLSFHELKTQFPPVSVVAVNQCSGNSRSFFTPRIPGGQWKHGAMGNARWTGVRLRDLLDAAGVRAGALQVALHGLDRPPLASTPMFEKSLDIDHARDGDVMVAYAMNDQPLPMLNGFPIRLVVPGWYATYWVKSLSNVTVGNEPYKGYWMDKAYRIPLTKDAQETHDQLAKETQPISRFSVRSIFVRPEPMETVRAGHAYPVEGVAMDDGTGITRVEISSDDGKTWTDTQLDPVIDKFSWRRFRFAWTPIGAGSKTLCCRATNAAGQTQTIHQWNHGGYARNQIETVTVKAVG